MRLFNVGITSALAALCLYGCAHAPPYDRAPTAAAVVSYRSVRAGAAPISAAGDVRFCAGNDGVQVQSTRRRSTDDWADKFEDRDLQEDVRGVIARDPTLSSQPLHVRVHGGDAIIGGTVQRDADAVAAARHALAVPGVVAVELQTTSLESPTPPRLVATLCQ